MKVVIEHPHTQACQYALKTLLKLNLSDFDLNIVKETLAHDNKTYNRQIAETIVAKYSINKNGTFNYLVSSISNIIATYRHGEIPALDKQHIITWIHQFPKHQQEGILTEINFIVNNTYLSKNIIYPFVKELAGNKELTTDDPFLFWKNVHVLDIQKGGNSQKDLNAILYDVVNKSFDFNIKENTSETNNYIYMDDVLFSGNRIRNDLEDWVEKYAPSKCIVNIIVFAYYLGGQYYCSRRLEQKAKQCAKQIQFVWWREKEFENRKFNKDYSDNFNPRFFSTDPDVEGYIRFLTNSGYPPLKRETIFNSSCFSSEKGRSILEDAFLTAGCKIRKMCPFLPERMRPLGYNYLSTLGFGSTVITYRNCPNTTPLALWAGSPWYPLFPRKIN